MGRQADRAVHACVWASQLGLRFSDLLRVAASVWRRRGAFSDWLVHRVDHYPGAGGFCYWHAVAILPEPSPRVPRRAGIWVSRRRCGPSSSRSGPMVRFRRTATTVLRLFDRRDSCLLGARRNHEGLFLPPYIRKLIRAEDRPLVPSDAGVLIIRFRELFADRLQFLPALCAGFRISEFESFERIKDNAGYNESCVFLVVGGNDIPGRVSGACRTNSP